MTKKKVYHQVVFTSDAWLKMQALVINSNKEICWYGLCKQLNAYSYIVYDILVHPQEVTSATVRLDDAEYAKWLNSLSDDEFNNLRFEGHSHVNMSVTRSGQDSETEIGMANQLKPGQFMIFVIMNKKMELAFRLYRNDNNKVSCLEFNNYEILINNKTASKYSDDIIAKRIKTKTYSYPTYVKPSNKKTTNKTSSEKKRYDAYEYDDDYSYDQDWYDKYFEKYGGGSYY